MYITYRQLFGYGWWSTLWRLFVVMLTQVAVLVMSLQTMRPNDLNDVEMFQGIQDAIIIYCGSDIVGLLLQCINGVTHGYAYGRL